MAKEIPVYLFVGFLESGKTKFIQETFEDPNFDSGDKTLLLVCEEGEIEYDPSKFAFGSVHVAQIEDKSELTAENLTALEKKSGCGRVIIEYNGMWLLQDLADALPENWLVYQCIATADGTTALTYARDNSMRSLLLDKIARSELIVFNRAEAVNNDAARQELHKLVRQASRKCDIAYEFKDGSVAYDDIPDPLPFDVDAPVIEIPEEFFGIWYMDCMDDPKKYDGKTVKYLAQVCQTPQAGKGAFVPGRFAMTCCVQDIQFVGMPCKYDDYKSLEQRSWINITAKVNVKYAYGNKFNGDPDITAAMDTWYAGGTQVVFACGGGIFTSAADAAKKVSGAKMIGVDVDQAGVINGYSGVEDMTVTSAMKGLAATVKTMLTETILNNNWDKFGGKVESLGLVSGDDPELNYVQIPMTSTQWADGKFTQADYKTLVKAMFDGTIKVSNDITAMPKTTTITVENLGNLK